MKKNILTAVLLILSCTSNCFLQKIFASDPLTNLSGSKKQESAFQTAPVSITNQNVANSVSSRSLSHEHSEEEKNDVPSTITTALATNMQAPSSFPANSALSEQTETTRITQAQIQSESLVNNASNASTTTTTSSSSSSSSTENAAVQQQKGCDLDFRDKFVLWEQSYNLLKVITNIQLFNNTLLKHTELIKTSKFSSAQIAIDYAALYRPMSFKDIFKDVSNRTFYVANDNFRYDNKIPLSLTIKKHDSICEKYSIPLKTADGRNTNLLEDVSLDDLSFCQLQMLAIACENKQFCLRMIRESIIRYNIGVYTDDQDISECNSNIANLEDDIDMISQKIADMQASIARKEHRKSQYKQDLESMNANREGRCEQERWHKLTNDICQLTQGIKNLENQIVALKKELEKKKNSATKETFIQKQDCLIKQRNTKFDGDAPRHQYIVDSIFLICKYGTYSAKVASQTERIHKKMIEEFPYTTLSCYFRRLLEKDIITEDNNKFKWDNDIRIKLDFLQQLAKQYGIETEVDYVEKGWQNMPDNTNAADSVLPFINLAVVPSKKVLHD